jgi:hypothetical protein
MKKLQFSLVLSVLVLAAAACNKEEQAAPPVETAPAETMAPPATEVPAGAEVEAPVEEAAPAATTEGH